MQAMISSLFSNMSKELLTFFMAMIPLAESKVSIPVAILKFKLSPQVAFLWSFLGSLLMGVVIFVLLKFLFERVLLRNKVVNKIWDKSIGVLRKRNSGKFKVIEVLVIIFFTVIPLPGFGIFLGGVVANILRTNFDKAIACLIWGNFLSGGVVLIGIFGFKL